MFKLPYLLLLLLLGSCYDQVDGFQPLSETNKRKIPSSYTAGDTLVYVYSDSLSMDTLFMVVQPNKDYLVKGPVIPEVYHTQYYQIIEQELRPLDGSASVLLVAGACYDYDRNDSEKFYFKYKGSKLYYSYLSSIKSNPEVYVYPFNQVSNSFASQRDSVFLSYSAYSGIQLIDNISDGYQLKRIQ